jgi:hypothetical protein
MPDDERKILFNAMDVANQGQNTYTKLTNLTLEQGKTYYVFVMGRFLSVLFTVIELPVRYTDCGCLV